MRALQGNKIDALKKLTELREATLTVELAHIASELSSKENEIAKLRSRVQVAGAVEDMKALANWQIWRDHELKRLNAEHAILRTRHDRCARAMGKAVAENSVIDHLRDISDRDAATRDRKRAEQLSPLHFLAHNIGDQDV